MNRKNGKSTTPRSFLVSDEAGMVLRIERKGKWLVVSSPFDPELITQAKTIEEAFAMAYDAKEGLEAVRAEAARARAKANAALSAPRRATKTKAAPRTLRRTKPAGTRT